MQWATERTGPIWQWPVSLWLYVISWRKREDEVVRSAPSADRSASVKAAPAAWHGTRSSSPASINASTGLSQNNFAKFLTSILTRMILRSLRLSLSMGLVFDDANPDLFLNFEAVLVFITLRDQILLAYLSLLQRRKFQKD